MIEAGLEHYCDRVAFHLYSEELLAEVAEVATKPVWVTESGSRGAASSPRVDDRELRPDSTRHSEAPNESSGSSSSTLAPKASASSISAPTLEGTFEARARIRRGSRLGSTRGSPRPWPASPRFPIATGAGHHALLPHRRGFSHPRRDFVRARNLALLKASLLALLSGTGAEGPGLSAGPSSAAADRGRGDTLSHRGPAICVHRRRRDVLELRREAPRGRKPLRGRRGPRRPPRCVPRHPASGARRIRGERRLRARGIVPRAFLPRRDQSPGGGGRVGLLDRRLASLLERPGGSPRSLSRPGREHFYARAGR